MINSKQIEQFKTEFRGQIIQKSDAEYENACKVYNGMIHKQPLLFAYCTDVSDVINAVKFGRENNLLIAVRGGGHNAGGLGTCDDGLVIDLSKIRYTRVDTKNKTVRVGGGCTWGDVDHATYQFGMVTPSGIISTTGVGGLTLGGGLGHLTRRFGLSIDNLLEADVVLADGKFVTASSEENQDLFWAIRGGGGNFGIVTSFLFKLHPLKYFMAGPTFYEIEKTASVMHFFDDFIKTAPEEINGFFAFMIVPPVPLFPDSLHLKNVCAIVWTYTGTEDKAEEILAPIKKFGPPLLFGIQPMPYPAMQSLFDALYPPGLQWYWRADFVNELSDKAIEKHIKFGSNLPTMFSSMHIYPVNGMASRIKNSDTAWNYRNTRYSQVIVGVDPDPANKDKITSWTKQYYDAVHPFSAGGAYVNFMMEEGEDRVRASYNGNYKRLTEIKKKYDPHNVFKVNQNIKPSA